MAIPFEDSINRTTATPRFTDEVFADLTARNAYAGTLRYEGMTCYVESKAKNYQLQGGITNSDWVQIGAGGGGGGGSFNWRPSVNSGYLEDTLYNLKVMGFDRVINNVYISAIADFTLPDDYQVGDEYRLKFKAFIDQSGVDIKFNVNAYNRRSGDSVVTLSNVASDSQEIINSSMDILVDFDIGIVPVDGDFAGRTAQAGDFITTELTRYPSTSTNDGVKKVWIIQDSARVVKT